MNTRDPFNLRRSSPAYNVLQTNANSVRTRPVEGGTSWEPHRDSSPTQATSVSMSSYAPPGGPTLRAQHDTWQASARSKFDPTTANNANGGIAEKVGEFFGADKKAPLPMYKDKPYAYPGSARRVPWYRRRRLLALALVLLTGIFWWLGLTPSLGTSGGGSKSSSRGMLSWWSGRKNSGALWLSRAEMVKEAFKVSFSGYEKHAWGADTFSPISKQHRQMTPSGMGWIIVDALDTMMLMNLSTEVTHARQWINSNLTYDQDHDVNTFETTIRMLGGLLSAHYLSTEFPGRYAPVDDGLSADMYIEKATDLADRLTSAYGSSSGVPFASVNLHTYKGLPSHADGGASSTAEATTLQLEMKYLSKLTGEDLYWKKAERVMKVVDDNGAEDGLVPIFIYADGGSFRGNNVRLGSRGDSYYEYLIKQYLQTSQEELVYQEMWNETLAGIKKHLLTYSSPSNFTVLAERPDGLDRKISPKMDHLVCFMPGTIALATTEGLPLAQAKKRLSWGPQQEEDMRLAEELMNTCWATYKVNPTGLAGEITHFNIYDPPRMYNDYPVDAKPRSPELNAKDSQVGKEDCYVKGGDAHNLQRPETVESLFYMWRITGDEKYRDWGWQMFESFTNHTAVENGTGYSSLSSVVNIPAPTRDNMESFWLAETLKYFYLLFSTDDILPLTDVVFNTEAHAFPRFKLGKLFKTGWERRSKGKASETAENQKSIETRTETQPAVLQTVKVAAETATTGSTGDSSAEKGDGL